MPPKFLFTKEQITAAALAVVRVEGIAALTAKRLAEELGTSAKPIFGLFSGMEEVKFSVMEAAGQAYQTMTAQDMAKGVYPAYKASGMAYIRFAKEEPLLFRLLFMRDRSNETIVDERVALRPILEIIMKNTGLDEEHSYLLHLEMWIYVHGIATMFATNYLPWGMDFVSNTLTDVYQGLCYRFIQGGSQE